MLRLFENGAFDPVLLAERLGAENNLSAVGGAEYIAELAAIGGAPVNAPAYAALVREMAQLRRMIETLNDSLNRSFNPGDDNPMKILDEVAAQLSDISTRFEHERRTVEEIKTFTRPYFDKMTDVINSGDFSRLLGATTGLVGWTNKPPITRRRFSHSCRTAGVGQNGFCAQSGQTHFGQKRRYHL